MHGVRWYSFKHNAWATVTNEPRTKRGYYTVEFDKGIFRRYNADRIQREAAEYVSVDTQLAAQLSVNPVSSAFPAVQANVSATVSRGAVSERAYSDTTHTPVEANRDAATVSPRTQRRGVLIGLVFEKR